MVKKKTESTRINLFLNPEIVVKAKVQAIKEKRNVSKLVNQAIEEYLKRQRKARVEVVEFDPLG